MDKKVKEFEKSFENLEAMVYNAVAKINDLRKINKDLKAEVTELKRLQALSEKKAGRLQARLDEVKTTDKKTWELKQEDIKSRLKSLSAKLSAFERSYLSDN